MNKTNSSVDTPKTVSADTQKEAIVAPAVRFTCAAVVNFERIAKNSPIQVDPFTGRRIRVFPKGSLEGLKEGAQNYYERAIEAEQCVQCFSTRARWAEESARESRERAIQAEGRALLAENKCKNLTYGLVVAVSIIGAGAVTSLIIHFRKRKEKRQKGDM